MSEALIHFTQARQALQKAKTIDEVKTVRDAAERLRLYLRQVNESLEMQNDAAEIKLRAERRAGEMLKEGAENGDRQSRGGDRKSNNHDERLISAPTLKEVGITQNQSTRWQSIASIPEERFERIIEHTKESREELTQAVMLQAAKSPHVAHNSGNNEWYTPPEFIEAARAVMGGIDVDPASSETANGIVGAASYFTAEDDGLAKEWQGRVWMNPPYAGELIGKFTAKLCQHFNAGEVTEAIVLVNNATETGWFQEMAALASAICFPKGRIKYLDVAGNPAGAPLQGQALIYLGRREDKFAAEFERFGWLSEPRRQETALAQAA